MMAADKENEETENAAAEGEEGAEAVKKGLPLKKILIIAIPLLLLIGGGAGAYFAGALDGLLGKKPVATADAGHGAETADDEHAAAEGEDPAAAEEVSSEEGGGEHGGGGGGEHGAAKPTGPAFLKVTDEKGQDLVINLNAPEGQMRYLNLGIQLELKSHGDIEKVKGVMPRIVDQYQTFLRELRVKDLRGSAGIYRLQMELLARVNQAIAPLQVKDVLIDKFIIQ